MANIKHAQIAVIGSVGKSDVAQLIGAGLRNDAPIYFTDNRELRVKSIEHAIAIHEIDPEAIVYDTAIKPDVAVLLPQDDVTNINFDIVGAMVFGGVIIIADCYEYPSGLFEQAEQKNLRILSVSLEQSADVWAERMVMLADCSCVMADIAGESITYKIGLAGKYSVLNSLMALAVIKVVGGDIAMAALSFASHKARKGYGRELSIGIDGRTCIIVDYAQGLKRLSVSAVMDHLSRIKTGKNNRRIVVLSNSDIQYDGAIRVQMLTAGVTRVLSTGDAIASLASKAGIITEQFQTNDTLKSRLQMMARAGDVVLVLGTQVSGFSGMIETLVGHFDDDDATIKIAAE